MKINDTIGTRVGKLTVVEDSGRRTGTNILWRCRCDCGNEILLTRKQIMRGRILSCGCVSSRRAVPNSPVYPGNVFGNLTVIGDSGQREGSYILWRCRCSCGNEILLPRYRLLSGTVTSCGCISDPRKTLRRNEDMIGRVFGNLTVISRAENDRFGRSQWNCRCSCGNCVKLLGSRLRAGKNQSCGCLVAGPRRNLTGQRFGCLTVQAVVPGRVGALRWHCVCDCGNELDVLAIHLLQGKAKSCGSPECEKAAARIPAAQPPVPEAPQEIPKDSSSGFRGVRHFESGNWGAYITFHKAYYHMGTFTSFEEAVQARLKAEDTLQGGYLKALTAYEKKAKADPQWARANPFFFEVEFERPEFRIRTNGELP